MVTKTREQIDSGHSLIILDIRARHLERQEISHDEYHSRLNSENERHRTELIAEGYPLNAASPEWQEEWGKADTAEKKMAVLAKMQGLEG